VADRLGTSRNWTRSATGSPPSSRRPARLRPAGCRPGVSRLLRA